MHRIDTSTAQKDKFGAGKNGFTLGNAQTGVPPTEVSADILDAIQEEIAAVIEDPDSGATLDKKKNNQLLTAIKAIIRSVGMLATETTRGPISVATQLQTENGADDGAAVTPKKLRFGFLALIEPSGYIVFPKWMLGFTIQWKQGATDQSGRFQSNWPIQFPVKHVAAWGISGIGGTTSADPNALTLTSSNETGFLAQVGGSNISGRGTIVFGFGR